MEPTNKELITINLETHNANTKLCVEHPALFYFIFLQN